MLRTQAWYTLILVLRVNTVLSHSLFDKRAMVVDACVQRQVVGYCGTKVGEFFDNFQDLFFDDDFRVVSTCWPMMLVFFRLMERERTLCMRP